jgi:hypothetical protein
MESLRYVTAAVFAVGLTGLAQAQTPTPAPTQDPTRTTSTAPAERIIITGCVQREADYRQTHDTARSGAIGNGIIGSTADEFVLIDATGSNPSSGAPPSAVGTSGTTSSSGSPVAGSATMSYELSGPQEARLANYAGQRVEVSGMLKPQESQDLKLREIEVLSFRSVDGSCPR